MVSRHRYSLLLPVMVLALGLFSLYPSSVSADGDTPTPEPTLEAEVTPQVPTEAADTSESSIDKITSAAEVGLEVAISEGGADSTMGDESSAYQLVSNLPIWCPEGVKPIPGQNGCTAEFGSISALMDFLNQNAPEEAGTIWVSDAFESHNGGNPLDQSAPVPEGENSENSESESGMPGVELIILDAGGSSLPLESPEGSTALMSGQPIWCPDGITPDNSGESCTSSSGSLGLLVSMMENGSLQDGAIYIQTSESKGEAAENSELTTDDQVAGFESVTGPLPEGLGQVADTGKDPVAEPTGEVLPVEVQPSLNSVLHDPIWCPNSALPNPGNGGCTPAQTDLESLITYLLSNEPNADGTIWIELGGDGSSGNISINGNVFTNWRDNSLTVQGGWGGTANDPSVTGITTFLKAISITNWIGDVVVNDIDIQSTTSTGLNVLTSGNITLDNVSASGNALDGIFVHNDVLGSTADVTLTGINASTNVDDGLVVRSNGDITADQITASGNNDVGAYFRNDTGSGTVTLTGVNVFNNNGLGPGALQNGIKIDSNGSIILNNITANGNGNSGANFATNSDFVTLAGSNSFIGNLVTGLEATISNGGSMDLQNITATNNLSQGASLTIGAGAGGGLIHIYGTNVFSMNASDGLATLTYGDIILDNIDASGNTGSASGARLGTACNITINSSTLNGNAAYGFDDSLSLPTYPASIALNSVTISGNGSGNYLVNNPNTVIPAATTYPCTVLAGNASLRSVLAQPIVLPLNSVSIAAGSSPVDLDCTQFIGTKLVLANGDQVSYLCPTLGEASLMAVEEEAENFPGELPQEMLFVSAMETHLTEAGINQALTSGDLFLSFVIPVDVAGFDFAILFFDGTNWLDLSTASFSDGKVVSNGGFKTEDGMFEATVNFTGLFVLVRK